MENTEIDINTKLYLEQKRRELKTLLISTYYGVGKIIKDVKERLIGRKIIFDEWVIETGLSPFSAKECLEYYETCEKYPGKLEMLPKALVLEFGKKDTPKQLADKVLSGEIKTAKEFKALKKEIALLKPEIDSLSKENQKLKQENSKLYKDYENIIDIKSKLEIKLEQSENRNISELKSIFMDINDFIGGRASKARFYLSKLDNETANQQLKKGLSDIGKTLLLFSEV